MDRKICLSIKRKERDRHRKQARYPAKDFSKKNHVSNQHVECSSFSSVYEQSTYILPFSSVLFHSVWENCPLAVPKIWGKNEKCFALLLTCENVFFCQCCDGWVLGLFFSFSHGSNPGWIDLDVQIKFHPK